MNTITKDQLKRIGFNTDNQIHKKFVTLALNTKLTRIVRTETKTLTTQANNLYVKNILYKNEIFTPEILAPILLSEATDAEINTLIDCEFSERKIICVRIEHGLYVITTQAIKRKFEVVDIKQFDPEYIHLKETKVLCPTY